MRAIVLHTTGGPEVLKVTNVPDPKIGPSDCLIRIKFAGVNYADILSRQGLYNWQGIRPYILGLESSGVIEAVGADVSKFKVGDKVVVGSKGGNYAELIVKNENDIFHGPEGLTYEQLACLCGNWATAWIALFELARVRPKEIALIHSGAGGVGTAAIQLSVAYGMEVYATASTKAKQDYVASLGARPLTYEKFDTTLCGPRTPDFILESVGGDIHDRSLKMLAPLGRMASIGASSIKIEKSNPLSWYRAWKTYPRVSRGALSNRAYMTLHVGYLLEEHREKIIPLWDRMVEFMQQHDLRPTLHTNSVFPMSQAAKAHALIDSRENIGKLLLDPSK